MIKPPPDDHQLLSDLLTISQRMDHLVASQDWDGLEALVPLMESLCDRVREADLSRSPEALLAAESFIVLESRLRPLLQGRLEELKNELSSQQNTSRLTNTYSF